MKWPRVAIVIVTYNRPVEIRRTIKALKAYLSYDGLLAWHLADDQSPGRYVEKIRQDFPDLHFSASVTARRGWGGNVNEALKRCKTTYAFLCEDDYVAKRAINLSLGVALLEKEHKIGLVRYDGIEGHTLDLKLCTTKTPTGDVAYATIEQSSPHLNIYSNRPHLKHLRFHGYYGRYPEGLPLGATEDAFAHHIKDNLGEGPKLAVLADGMVRAFDHVGQSWKGSSYDKQA